ncbi:pectate lyase [Curvibacter sp. CHRR-16]|uniref:pectate lyase family protein n=1 Tax=Curvibacter sp. CHRR-16 TaxID=2835872 RepID=UPI001BDB2BA6|nr:pectate lyase [Curvibacter sp. CHRR-16]MBT0570832.1 pectate lyase [Curvibacter sp. CHRR-16]
MSKFAKTVAHTVLTLALIACGGGGGGSGGSGSGSGSGSSEPSTQVTGDSGGYADVRSGGVTGGGNSPATTVTVSTAAAMQTAINNYSGTGGLVIIYNGTFDFSTIPDPCTQWQLPAGDIVEIKNKSHITIQGSNGSAANFGLAIKQASENIIIRNMTIGLLPGSIDAIGIEGQSSKYPAYIWIDHNTLFSSMTECSGAGDLEFDGLVDNKAGAHHITYSYNYIHDHHKVGLMGSSETDITDRYVTFHHNYYKNVGSRTPLQRGGYTHLYNNLYSQLNVSGINVRLGGYALVESNYFENSVNPITSRDSDTVGYWELRNNNITSASQFSTYSITWGSCSGDCLKNATDWATTATFPKTIAYTYTPNTPACVKSGLPSVVGAGKNLATLSCS